MKQEVGNAAKPPVNISCFHAVRYDSEIKVLDLNAAVSFYTNVVCAQFTIEIPRPKEKSHA